MEALLVLFALVGVAIGKIGSETAKNVYFVLAFLAILVGLWACVALWADVSVVWYRELGFDMPGGQFRDLDWDVQKVLYWVIVKTIFFWSMPLMGFKLGDWLSRRPHPARAF